MVTRRSRKASTSEMPLPRCTFLMGITTRISLLLPLFLSRLFITPIPNTLLYHHEKAKNQRRNQYQSHNTSRDASFNIVNNTKANRNAMWYRKYSAMGGINHEHEGIDRPIAEGGRVESDVDTAFSSINTISSNTKINQPVSTSFPSLSQHQQQQKTLDDFTAKVFTELLLATMSTIESIIDSGVENKHATSNNNIKPDNIQAKSIKPDDIQSDDIQSDIIQSNNIQSDNNKADNIQANNIQSNVIQSNYTQSDIYLSLLYLVHSAGFAPQKTSSSLADTFNELVSRDSPKLSSSQLLLIKCQNSIPTTNYMKHHQPPPQSYVLLGQQPLSYASTFPDEAPNGPRPPTRASANPSGSAALGSKSDSLDGVVQGS